MPPRQPDFITSYHASSYDFISPSKLDLRGRYALVTGAANADGVGFATVLALIRAGVSGVMVADIQAVSEEVMGTLRGAAAEAKKIRDDHPESGSRGGASVEATIVACKVDIASLESVKMMHQLVSDRFSGRLDILVNNAAHQEPYKTILESDAEKEWRTWEVNVHGLMNMTRVFLPVLLESAKGGRAAAAAGPGVESSGHAAEGQVDTARGLCTIINVASSGALSARAGSANYRASKLAILRWTEILQLDHVEQGLLAYCVNPGAIRTQMTINEPEAVRAMLPHKPELAGDTIAWLASERRDWLAGRYISCPWDMEVLLRRKEEIVERDLLKMRLGL